MSAASPDVATSTNRNVFHRQSKSSLLMLLFWRITVVCHQPVKPSVVPAATRIKCQSDVRFDLCDRPWVASLCCPAGLDLLIIDVMKLMFHLFTLHVCLLSLLLHLSCSGGPVGSTLVPGCGGSLRRLSDVIQCWSEKMMTTSPPAELRSPAQSRSSSFWSHSDEGTFLWPPSEVLQLLLLLASSSRNVSLHLQSNSEDINKYEEALCHYEVKENTFTTSKYASC